MRRRRKIIIISVVSAVLAAMVACLTYVFFTFTVEVNLKGADIASVEVFSEFTDEGAEAYISIPLFGLSFDIETEEIGNIDTDKLGTYKKEYKAVFLGRQNSALRTVTVQDTTAPVIKTESETILVDFTEKKDNSLENIKINFTATDLYDGDITHTAVKSYDGKGCTISVKDSSGNEATARVDFIYPDRTAPVISLENTNTVYIMAGEKYEEVTFTATDDVDGDITKKVEVSGKPDTGKVGTYIVTYKVSDSSYNTGYAKRTVVVYGKASAKDFQTVIPNEKTIYLTFDDGPGKYTEELLGILDNYGVKVTFFVTNQFPKYQNMIGKAYKAGHSVGVHTYSHKFQDIYSSKESYLTDFEKINSIVKEQTGKSAEIFRFPGGTNNIVSKKYSIGIMKSLVNEMSDRGYLYFDWNFDSGDTAGKNRNQIINNVIKHIDTRLKTENYTIILMHDIKSETIKAVPAIIEYGLEHGYTFAALDTASPNKQFIPAN